MRISCSVVECWLCGCWCDLQRLGRSRYTMLMRLNNIETTVQWFRMCSPDFLVMEIQLISDSFICILLNVFKYCYATQAIQYNIRHLFAQLNSSIWPIDRNRPLLIRVDPVVMVMNGGPSIPRSSRIRALPSEGLALYSGQLLGVGVNSFAMTQSVGWLFFLRFMAYQLL